MFIRHNVNIWDIEKAMLLTFLLLYFKTTQLIFQAFKIVVRFIDSMFLQLIPPTTPDALSALNVHFYSIRKDIQPELRDQRCQKHFEASKKYSENIITNIQVLNEHLVHKLMVICNEQNRTVPNITTVYRAQISLSVKDCISLYVLCCQAPMIINITIMAKKPDLLGERVCQKSRNK